MRKNLIIKKSLAAFLLLVFAIATIPKKFLHDAFANHKDATGLYEKKNANKEKIATSTFHCQCDDLVVEAPFIPEQPVISFLIPSCFIILPAEVTNSFITIAKVKIPFSIFKNTFNTGVTCRTAFLLFMDGFEN